MICARTSSSSLRGRRAAVAVIARSLRMGRTMHSSRPRPSISSGTSTVGHHREDRSRRERQRQRQRRFDLLDRRKVERERGQLRDMRRETREPLAAGVQLTQTR